MSHYVYVASSQDDRISIFTMDPETGRLNFLADVELSGGPAPLAVDPQRRFLFAGRRSTRQLSSFSIDQGTGGLTHIAAVPLESDPCFVATDRKGRFLLSSYYSAGAVAVHSIGAGGAVSAAPVEWISTAAKAHSIQTDSSNQFAFVPHVGESNVIFQFEFDEDTGALKPNVVSRALPGDGQGPRHFCFHPHQDIVYFSNEQGCSVTAYHLDPAAGTLAALQTISTLPADFRGSNTCSQIQITSSGKFLYAPNRGHDSIACFAVDSSGRLTAAGHQPTPGTPRAFRLDPRGIFLFAAGLGADKLSSYRIDSGTGTLEPLQVLDVGKGPMWVLVTELP
jgi:6-phosphogluconolactonase